MSRSYLTQSLNNLEKGHLEEIKDFTQGPLNDSKTKVNYDKVYNRSKWPKAEPTMFKDIINRKLEKLPAPDELRRSSLESKFEALTAFSVGTHGILPQLSRLKSQSQSSTVELDVPHYSKSDFMFYGSAFTAKDQFFAKKRSFESDENVFSAKKRLLKELTAKGEEMIACSNNLSRLNQVLSFFLELADVTGNEELAKATEKFIAIRDGFVSLLNLPRISALRKEAAKIKLDTQKALKLDEEVQSLEQQVSIELDRHTNLTETEERVTQEYKHLADNTVLRIDTDPQPKSESDWIKSERCRILSMQDEIDAIKAEVRSKFVPMSLYDNLNVDYKHMTVELSVLVTEFDDLNELIKKHKTELADEIVASGTNLADEDRIWKKVELFDLNLPSDVEEVTVREQRLKDKYVIEPELPDDFEKYDWYIS